jgi:hypothetical protein
MVLLLFSDIQRCSLKGIHILLDPIHSIVECRVAEKAWTLCFCAQQSPARAFGRVDFLLLGQHGCSGRLVWRESNPIHLKNAIVIGNQHSWRTNQSTRWRKWGSPNRWTSADEGMLPRHKHPIPSWITPRTSAKRLKPGTWTGWPCQAVSLQLLDPLKNRFQICGHRNHLPESLTFK